MTRLVTIAVLLTVASPAAGQQYSSGFSLQQLVIAPEYDRIFWTDGSEVARHLGVSASLFMHFTDDPLWLVVEQNGERLSREPVVDHQLYGDLAVALGFLGWGEVQLGLPVKLSGSGDAERFSGVSDAAAGDLKLRARFRILKRDPNRGGHGVAASIGLGIPLSDSTGLAAEDSVSIGVRAAYTYKLTKWLLAANLGARVRTGGDPVSNLALGHEVLYSVGARHQSASWADFGMELFGRLDLSSVTSANAPLEVVAGPRFAFAGAWAVDVGLGTGLVGGYGTPDLRMFAGVQYTPFDRDTDGDRIMDSDDACPADPEDVDGFQDTDGCPEPDNDKDGVLDGKDKCPNVPEDVDRFQDKDGCPDSDNDKDGWTDKEDKCPNKPEDLDGFKDEDGCPDPDNDGDKIPDVKDKCPDKPEVVNGVDDLDGCPDEKAPVVVVKADAIVLMQKVHFDTGKATLRPESHDLLEAVAKALADHADIELVEVRGHTDDRGSNRKNMTLSQRRVEMVCAFLHGAGVDPARLQPTGYGESKPLAKGRSDEARAENRRVEFVILRRTPVR